jgi:hypothetical protein
MRQAANTARRKNKNKMKMKIKISGLGGRKKIKKEKENYLEVIIQCPNYTVNESFFFFFLLTRRIYDEDSFYHTHCTHLRVLFC